MIDTLKTPNSFSSFIELIPELACIKNLNGEYTHCNYKFLNIFNKERNEIIGKTDFDLFSYEEALQLVADDKLMLEQNTNQIYKNTTKTINEQTYYFQATKEILLDENNSPSGILCVARDITLEKQYEFIYEDTQTILEYITAEDDLHKILNKIVNLAEKRNNSALCSILLLDDEKKHLYTGAAPSLPEFYNNAIDGTEIGENIGSCGSAAYTRKRVIVKDIDTHENWQPYLSLTQEADLHSCWSEPIISSQNEVLGTFAIYHHSTKSPGNFELKLINSFAHLAAVAIEKKYNDIQLKQKEFELLQQTKQSNEILKKQEEELSLIFDNALVGLMYITGDRKLIKGNQHLAYILGYESPDEMTGISMLQLHLSEKRFLEFGAQNFEPLRDHKEAFNIEYQLRKKDGSSSWCLLSGKAIDQNTPADLYKGVLWTVRDINQRKALEAQIEEHTKEIDQKNLQLEDLVFKDYLTTLYNRSKIDEVLEYQVNYASRYHTQFGVIMVDIDYFKEVNDTYGHQTGDKVLKEFATILNNNARKTDTIGRWGGEEFLIVVENISQDDLLNLTEKLRKTVQIHSFPIVKNKTASFGTTLYKTSDTVEELIARADQALYNAKNSGRNCIKIEI